MFYIDYYLSASSMCRWVGANGADRSSDGRDAVDGRCTSSSISFYLYSESRIFVLDNHRRDHQPHYIIGDRANHQSLFTPTDKTLCCHHKCICHHRNKKLHSIKHSFYVIKSRFCTFYHIIRSNSFALKIFAISDDLTNLLNLQMIMMISNEI